MNTLTDELIEQYMDAQYRVSPGSRTFVLKIGEFVTQEFADVLVSVAADRWAVMTACNPYSRVLSELQNEQRQAQLEATLNDQGHVFYPAVGQSEDGKWQEVSVWVRGISRKQAKDFGIQFQQNAVVYGEADQAVELVLCV